MIICHHNCHFCKIVIFTVACNVPLTAYFLVMTFFIFSIICIITVLCHRMMIKFVKYSNFEGYDHMMPLSETPHLIPIHPLLYFTLLLTNLIKSTTIDRTVLS